MEIGVVIVTYNRLEKLRKCLKAYEKQTFLPSYVIVVNNCSTDKTAEYLEEWKNQKNMLNSFERIVFQTQSNLGGAGGFAFGMRQALNRQKTEKNSWIWIADDDAYPQKDCLENMVLYYEKLPQPEQQKIVSLCAKVVDNQGISPLHRRILKKSFLQIKELPLTEAEYQKEAVEIDFFSFVGTAVKREIIEKIGIPSEEYFIFYDDTEYSLRVRKEGNIKCLSKSVILHDSLENTIVKYSWKNYYMFRNKMYTYRKYFSAVYCFTDRIKILYMIWKFYNTPHSWEQYRKAKKDAKKGRLGMRQEYLPF